MNCIMRKYVLVSFRMKSNRRFHDFLITCGNSSAMQRNKSDWKKLIWRKPEEELFSGVFPRLFMHQHNQNPFSHRFSIPSQKIYHTFVRIFSEKED